jgi:hypothetical protein
VGSVLAITLAFAALAVQLRLEFRPGDLLPQGIPSWRCTIASTRTSARRTSDGDDRGAVGNHLHPDILSTIYRVTEAVDRLPGVNHDQIDSIASRFMRLVQVQSGGRMTADPIMSGPVTSIEQAKAIQRLVLAVGLHSRQPGFAERARGTQSAPGSPSVGSTRDAPFAAVNDTILPLANDQVHVYVAGQPRQNGWILALQWQVLLAFAAAIVLTWILLYRYFRDWRGALRPTISGGLARSGASDWCSSPGSRSTAHPGHSVPHHGEGGEPLGPDARPVLRGARRRRREGGGRAALLQLAS